MELLGSFLDTEYIKSLVGPDLIKYLVMAAIVIKTVGGHFKDMRDAVNKLTLEVHDFKDIFKDEIVKTENRFKEIEGRNEAIDYRVYALEIKLKEVKEN